MVNRRPTRSKRRKKQDLITPIAMTLIVLAMVFFVTYTFSPQIIQNWLGVVTVTTAPDLTAVSTSDEVSTPVPSITNPPESSLTSVPVTEYTETILPTATPKGNASQIAFSSNRTGNMQVWVMNGTAACSTH